MSDNKNKSLRFLCPHCSTNLKGNLSDAGRQRRCPNCEKGFRIPHPRVPAHEATPSKNEEYVPVVCGVCSTRMYATIDKIGLLMECPDCFTQTLVTALKKQAKSAAPRIDEGFGYDVRPEEELTVTKSLGQDLLHEADKVVKKRLAEEPKTLDRPFLSGVFFFPFYGRIFPVVLGMALAWALVFTLTRVAWDLQRRDTLLAPFVIAFTGILLLIVSFPTLVTLQKILENTSNGDEDTDCRPEGGLLAFIDWIGDIVPLMIALILSCAPGMIVMKVFTLPDVYYLAVVFLASLLFPIVLLSMLESASVSGVYSKPLLSSFRQLPGAWLKFYFISTLLFVLSGISLAAIAMLSVEEVAGKPVAGVITALMAVLVFAAIYFRLLGRLAFLFTQRIEVEEEMLVGFEPPPSEEDDAELPIRV